MLPSIMGPVVPVATALPCDTHSDTIVVRKMAEVRERRDTCSVVRVARCENHACVVYSGVCVCVRREDAPGKVLTMPATTLFEAEMPTAALTFQ